MVVTLESAFQRGSKATRWPEAAYTDHRSSPSWGLHAMEKAPRLGLGKMWTVRLILQDGKGLLHSKANAFTTPQYHERV